MQSTHAESQGCIIENGGNHVVNVTPKERIITVTVGSYLLARGIRKFSLFQTLLGGYMVYRGATGHCPIYEQIQRNKYTDKPESINIKATMVVNKPRAEVYDFWRKLENLPLFMRHLKSVKEIDNLRSHWEVKVPGNVTRVHWDAEIVKEEPQNLLSWKSLPGATVMNAGKVEFRDFLGHKGTELKVVITFRPPAGKVGGGIAWLLSPVFKKMISQDILNFKQYIETGFLPSVEE